VGFEHLVAALAAPWILGMIRLREPIGAHAR
jgi:hypothetical protein